MPTSTGQSCRNARLFGGCFYNSLTQGRLFGVRSGAGWQAIDNAYFDDPSAAPPYIEREWHASPRHAELFTKRVGWIMSTPDVPEIERQKRQPSAASGMPPSALALETTTSSRPNSATGVTPNR